MHGGLVQGIAQALWEGAEYDDAGHPRHRLVRRLHAADRGRHDQLRHRPHRVAVDDEHAGHQGSRRGRHHRLDAGGRQRDRRRAAAASASTTSSCRAPPSGCGRPSSPAGALRTTATGEAQPHFDGGAPNQDPEQRDGRSRPVIPAQFDYLAPDHRRGGPRGARRGRRRRQGARRRPVACSPILRMRLNAPETSSTSAASRRCSGIREDGDALVIGAMTTYADVLANRRSCTSTRRCCPRRSPRSPTRRSGTAARSAARWCTPTRPATSVRRSLALDAELVIAGPGGERTVRGGRLLRGPLRDGGRRGRAAHRRSASRSTPAGARTTRSSSGWRTSGRSSRSRRPCEADGGTIAEARIGLTNMGSTAAARHARRAGAGRPAGDRRGRPRGRRVGGRRHQPAVGPQRRRRLPQAPRHGADPPRGPRRGRSLSPMELTH